MNHEEARAKYHMQKLDIESGPVPLRRWIQQRVTTTPGPGRAVAPVDIEQTDPMPKPARVKRTASKKGA